MHAWVGDSCVVRYRAGAQKCGTLPTNPPNTQKKIGAGAKSRMRVMKMEKINGNDDSARVLNTCFRRVPEPECVRSAIGYMTISTSSAADQRNAVVVESLRSTAITSSAHDKNRQAIYLKKRRKEEKKKRRKESYHRIASINQHPIRNGTKRI